MPCSRNGLDKISAPKFNCFRDYVYLIISIFMYPIGVGAGPAGPVLAGPLFGDLMICVPIIIPTPISSKRRCRNVLREFQLYVPTAQLYTQLDRLRSPPILKPGPYP